MADEQNTQASVVAVTQQPQAGVAVAPTTNDGATVVAQTQQKPQADPANATAVPQDQQKQQSTDSGNVSQASDQALAKINRDLEEKSTAERAQTLNIPYIDVGAFPLNPDILHLVSPEDAKRGMCMIFYKTGKRIRVAVADPTNADTLGVVKDLQSKGYEVQMNLASTASIEDAFRAYASDQYKLKVETKNVVKDEDIHYEKELENLVKLKDSIESLPAEEALNLLHVSAIKAGASDMHYQPEETKCTIRFRIDGVLHNVFEVSHDVYARLANQLKYKAGMKLNITSVPQDGRFRFIVNERKIDVRASALPTEYGESFVCRILDSEKHFGSFDELGFIGKALESINRAAELAHGMVLVTGPTGSGKTTTLYVLLGRMNNTETKIITLEDPIEYHLSGITQSQINEKRGYNFAAGLRSILRQDPDVVMIGEIRDLETAEAAAQAALTGHVLLSTLHTNDAIGTIPRLINIGLPAFMVAPALSTIVAQRLVRRLCTCAVERDVTPDEKTRFEKVMGEAAKSDPTRAMQVPQKIKAVKGCESCNFTGFRGQLTVSEILDVDDEIRQMVLKNQSSGEILAAARKKGFVTLEEDATTKVLKGMTTPEEVHRVINA